MDWIKYGKNSRPINEQRVLILTENNEVYVGKAYDDDPEFLAFGNTFGDRSSHGNKLSKVEYFAYVPEIPTDIIEHIAQREKQREEKEKKIKMHEECVKKLRIEIEKSLYTPQESFCSNSITGSRKCGGYRPDPSGGVRGEIGR